MSFFSVSDLSAGYGKKKIVENISFEVEKGSLAGILGANGSGKTTLLKAVCGILPHEGSCMLENEVLDSLSVKRIARRCSYIPQRSSITIDLSVLDVVLMGFNPQLGLLAQPNKRMVEAAKVSLRQVGLQAFEQENYQHLSEGQKQLCILARTLVADSKLMLLDEPESALDFRYRHRLLSLVRGVIAEKQTAALVTLHDPTLALNFCDILLLLENGRLLGEIHPQRDPLEKVERMLREIYGDISLQYVVNRSGQQQLILLNEVNI